MIGDPVRHLGFGHADELPVLPIDLFANLQRVAPVGENRGGLGHHHGGAGGTLEAGQPGEPLSVFADIFAHMLIGQRHDKPVKAIALQLVAQRAETVGMAGHQIILGKVKWRKWRASHAFGMAGPAAGNRGRGNRLHSIVEQWQIPSL